ncbi:GGDEF domain-containing protein [Luedemannella flava]
MPRAGRPHRPARRRRRHGADERRGADRGGSPPSRRDAGALLIAAHHVAGLDRLSQLDALRRFANSDPLTGLRHHRPFRRRLAKATPGRTAVIAIDVDNFKSINDEYGHGAGDTALVRLGNALQAALRCSDDLYRVGGDEFAVLVEVAGEPEALAIAERLLRAARSAGHPVSAGVALRRDDEDGPDTLRRADAALYVAKRAGRDTARMADRPA